MKISFIKKYFHIFTLFCVIIVITLILILDIKNPYYSYIGDEFAFFFTAQNVIKHGILNLNTLTLPGAYEYHSILDSIYQATVMSIFGNNLIGWKMCNIALMDICIIIVYFLSLKIFKKKSIALSSSIFFGFSHYLLGFAHANYNNMHIMFSVLLTLLFYFKYRNSRKIINFFLTGIFSGLSLYTFQPAKLIIPIIVPFILFEKKKSIPYFLGLLVFAIPYFLFLFKDDIEMAKIQTFAQPNFQGWNLLGLKYLFFSLFSSKNLNPHHYVVGPIVTIIMSISLFAGILLIIKNIKKEPSRILLIFSLLVFSIIITISFYGFEIPTTRLHIIIPLISIISGYGMVEIFKIKAVIPLVLIIYIIMELNIIYKLPQKHPITQDALILSTMNQNSNQNICFIHNNHENSIRFLVEFYEMKNITFLYYTDPINNKYNCSYIILHQYNETTPEQFLLTNTDILKNKQKVIVYDKAKFTKVVTYQEITSQL